METEMTADKVRTQREHRGWTQEQLASIAGINVRTIQRLESGDKASAETLMALASAFGLSVSDLSSPQPAPAEAPSQQSPKAVHKLFHLNCGYSILQAIALSRILADYSLKGSAEEVMAAARFVDYLVRVSETFYFGSQEYILTKSIEVEARLRQIEELGFKVFGAHCLFDDELVRTEGLTPLGDFIPGPMVPTPWPKERDAEESSFHGGVGIYLSGVSIIQIVHADDARIVTQGDIERLAIPYFHPKRYDMSLRGGPSPLICTLGLANTALGSCLAGMRRGIIDRFAGLFRNAAAESAQS